MRQGLVVCVCLRKCSLGASAPPSGEEEEMCRLSDGCFFTLSSQLESGLEQQFGLCVEAHRHRIEPAV